MDTLMQRIKKLVTNWAEEEQMNGNKVFYWNIMSNGAMNTIASKVPLSLDELNDLGVLGENVVKEYGERLVKNINSFVEQNDLKKYMVNRVAKRPKTAESVPDNNTTKQQQKDVPSTADIDEYECDIDFAAIPLPSSPPVRSKLSMSRSKLKSSYFKK